MKPVIRETPEQPVDYTDKVMSISPILKTTAKLVLILAISVVAERFTIYAILVYDLRITTPGMVVAGFTQGFFSHPGYNLLTVIGVDCTVYFLLIWGSVSF